MEIPGLRHIELDVACPGAGRDRAQRSAAGGILQTAEFVEEPACDDFAVKASGGKSGGASNGSMTTRREVTAS